MSVWLVGELISEVAAKTAESISNALSATMGLSVAERVLALIP